MQFLIVQKLGLQIPTTNPSILQEINDYIFHWSRLYILICKAGALLPTRHSDRRYAEHKTETLYAELGLGVLSSAF